VTLYRKLVPRQHALKWGLPLVLGGALGNVFDRIRYGYVIDFVDAHALYKGHDHHWPTFNVADIAICVGVGLMAVDMFTSRRSGTPASLDELDARRRLHAAAHDASVDEPAHPPVDVAETSPSTPTDT
jgi:signal peptidase II